MRKVSPQEYQALKHFVGLFVDLGHAGAVHREVHPLHALTQAEQKSVEKARDQLQRTVNDLMDLCFAWHPERIGEADSQMVTRGALTLSQVRLRHSKHYQQVIKRGFLRSDPEYFLLKGILHCGQIHPSEKRQAEAIAGAFETTLAHAMAGDTP